MLHVLLKSIIKEYLQAPHGGKQRLYVRTKTSTGTDLFWLPRRSQSSFYENIIQFSSFHDISTILLVIFPKIIP